VKHLTLFILLVWGLSGCSSSSLRAPVSDLNFSAGKVNTYKVKSGDTLYAIATRNGLDLKTLVQYNNIFPPYIIYEGQLLNLSASRSPQASGAKKTSVKSNLPSQNKDKKSPTYCTGQSCNKNSGGKLVQRKTNAYSANQTNGIVAKRAAPVNGGGKISSWYWPAHGKLTKTFSSSQIGMKKGISVENQRGTAIYAAASGDVVYAGSGLSGYGNLIIIKHSYDYLSAYAHNETLLVRENEAIKVGQKIAVMGDSGTDSVHLHFEIRYRGKSVDPLRYLPKR